ncbi:DNA repair protein RadC [Lysinibacillus capsici]|uniref:JAB domain-containing protein n=1 Tax=Lysinibacillus capsici TaxID=2115968 RepID=UPI0027310AC2|nr:DNA repair protein RadC [Lysinibacillus capsici]MDP1394428.1 DNA repair protein RadC [Lysinibacillus capsici]MDP1414901.1 DNA repair protein RadC [Lysinibacillus capsici]MDP1430796.1 DNA repair protein RadC [Lysinibacillus capsici]
MKGLNKVDKKKVSPAKRINIVQIKLIRERSLLYKDRLVRSPQNAYEIIQSFLADCDREHFIVLCLDTKNQPTCIQTVHIGSLNASIVHPREVLKSAILSNSASIIVAHNHPSNIPTPSNEDIEVTNRLIEAGNILGIELLDHLIICENSFLSLKEKGYIKDRGVI